MRRLAIKSNTGSDNPPAGHQFHLSGNRAESVLGRSEEDCDFVLDDPVVSRKHARIVEQDGRVMLEDLFSRNGTFLNGTQVQPREPQPLFPGDVISICGVEMVYEESQPGRSRSQDTAERPEEGSHFEFTDQSNSTIMNRVELPSSHGTSYYSSSPEVRLNALLKITQSLGRSLVLDEVLPQVLDSLFEIFDLADRGFIVLRSEDGTLIPKWSQERRGRDEKLRISRTIINAVIDSREAILSRDAADDSAFSSSQSLMQFRIRSMMCAPLLDVEGKAFGALQIDTLDTRKSFRQEDLEVLSAVAIQAGIAISNAQLYEAALAQREVEQELALANEVQRSFLPRKRPAIPGLEFYDYYLPYNRVGGDYYDYITLPDGRLAVIVADVVGHGVPAALMMAKLASECRVCLVGEPTPLAAINALNTRMLGPRDRYTTLVLVVLDPDSHQVTVVNAAHPAPVVRRADGKVEMRGEEERGTLLGIFPDMEYEEHTFELQPGDAIVLFTDGLNESMNDDDEEFGMQRICELAAQPFERLDDLGQRILEDITRFVGGPQQTDDRCLVCVRRYEPESTPTELAPE